MNMNRQIRRLSAVLLCAFLLLFGNLGYWQFVRADELAGDTRNRRTLIEEYSIQRGQMLVGDEAVAVSTPTEGTLRFARQYPQGERYAFVTGFYSLVYGRSLLEQQMNDYLIGQAPEQFADNLMQLLTSESRPGGNLVLTLDPEVQAAAEEALGERKGAVVALDPRTGAVLALTSFPRYDPNRLSSHEPAEIRQAWEELQADDDSPMANRAAGEVYPPGSSFKVIAAAAAVELAGYRPDTEMQNATAYTPPLTTAAIRNFGRGTCMGGKDPITLAESLEVSCNTTFARLGNELGADKLVEMAERFGFNQDSPYQLPAAESVIPADLDAPAEAQSAIGQRDVRASPLQMATVAATIANGGVRMAPYVVNRVLAHDGSLVRSFAPEEVNQPISGETAAQLREMMARVVEDGTATAAQVAGVEVAGKTGTAEHAEGAAPHAWFMGFGDDGERQIAVAVVVEQGGDAGSEATGGRVSAPIAADVIRAYLGGGQ